MKKIDILLLARPDHSYGIYEELLKQEDIDYLYCSFKLLPSWLKSHMNNPRARYYSKGYSNCILQSLLHVYRVRNNKYKYEKYEQSLFEFHLKHLMPFIKTRLIHYWPYYSYKSVRKYKQKHPEVNTFADVYYPCENWVIDNIKPLSEQYGVKLDFSKVERDAGKLKEIMKFENNFLVPSEFVADTYRQYYPDKNYIVIPYGITIWENYHKKELKANSDQIKSFVYAGGGVTIEKGCDLMLDFFMQHPELELHIYGTIPEFQKEFFKKYELSENIHLHGFVAKSKLQEEISKYDVGIHFSRFDAYSLSVGEMTGAGLPVIISEKTGIFFHIQEIGAGLVSKLELDDISRCVESIRTPEVYNQMIDNIDKYIKISPKSYGERVIDFYKSKLNG